MSIDGSGYQGVYDFYFVGNGCAAGWHKHISGRLLHYALAGTLPGEGAVPPSGAVRPTDACLGSPTVVSS